MSTAKGRRPAIRLKASTPPRTTESSVVVVRRRLPPPRTPARRVLQIVPDDESDRQLHVMAASLAPVTSASDSQARAVARPIWKRPEVILAALAAFGTVLGIVLALVSSRAPSASATNEAPLAPDRADLRKGSETPASKPASAEIAPAQGKPQIPTFDVKSLPPARR